MTCVSILENDFDKRDSIWWTVTCIQCFCSMRLGRQMVGWYWFNDFVKQLPRQLQTRQLLLEFDTELRSKHIQWESWICDPNDFHHTWCIYFYIVFFFLIDAKGNKKQKNRHRYMVIFVGAQKILSVNWCWGVYDSDSWIASRQSRLRPGLRYIFRLVYLFLYRVFFFDRHQGE